MSRPIFHTMILCPKMSSFTSATYRETIRKIKKNARNHNIPFVMLKTGSAPGLLYAESHDLANLVDWTARIEALDRTYYKCAAPPAKAPVNMDDLPRYQGERFLEINHTTEFGEELAKRGLIDWWLKNEGFSNTKDTRRAGLVK